MHHRGFATPWIGLVLLLLALGAGQAVEAVLVRLDGQTAEWTLRQPADWQPPLQLTAADRPLRLTLIRLAGRAAATRLGDAPADLALRLGQRLDLQPLPDAPAAWPDPPAPNTAPHLGAVTALAGDEVEIRVGIAPDVAVPALVRHGESIVAELRWTGGEGARWRGVWSATGDSLPRLGDRVEYTAGEVAAEQDVAAAPPPTVPRLMGQENVVAPDHPIYDQLRALAARGLVPQATQRQFAGETEGVYTRAQLARFVAAMVRDFLDTERIWEVQGVEGQVAAQVALLVHEFRPELRAAGLDADGALADLNARRDDFAWFGTVGGEGRVMTGEERSAGRAEGTLFGAYGSRTRLGLTIGTEGGEPFPAERDRSSLAAWWLSQDLGDHWTIGLGRVRTRFGPGRNDLLWSDRAKPLDSLQVDWHTKILGRPFRLHQETGVFQEIDRKYVTTRRFEYLPMRGVTLGVGFGLITDKASQAAASMVLPLYAARFTAGEGRVGGYGNFLGSIDLAWRAQRDLAVYGQFFADDFDFSSSGPNTAQRVGWLGGLHYTPGWAPTGTSYRVEGVILPDPGTYVGQMNMPLSWSRDGLILGHEYGPDSAGVRFDAKHRLTDRWDVTGRLETFRQLRSSAAPRRTLRLDLGAHFDLNRYLSVGAGWQHRSIDNRGGVIGNDWSDDALYFETTAGY